MPSTLWAPPWRFNSACNTRSYADFQAMNKLIFSLTLLLGSHSKQFPAVSADARKLRPAAVSTVAYLDWAALPELVL